MATVLEAGWLSSVGEWIGEHPRSEFELAAYVEDRLPTNVVRTMQEHGLTTREVHSLVIPERTLKHRRSRREKLSREESDRAVRTARLLARAESIFGSREKALLWARQAKQRFQGKTPFDMLTTEAGCRLVEEML